MSSFKKRNGFQSVFESKLDQFLQSRRASEERARIHKVGESLRKRLAPFLRTGVQVEPPRVALDKGSHTDKFNRVLVLWLDLQREFSRARQSDHNSHRLPWNTEDKVVSELWEDKRVGS